MAEEAKVILTDFVRAWDKPRGFPPQDLADLMGELRKLVERARIVINSKE